MAKKVLTQIKLQIPAGRRPRASGRPCLGQHGVNHHGVCKASTRRPSRTPADHPGRDHGLYEDRSFDFITKTPPAAILIKEAAGIEKGPASRTRRRSARSPSTRPARSPSGRCPTWNANDLDAATKIIAGTARSMGVTVERALEMAHGKRYRDAYEKIDRTKAYPPAEAIHLIKETGSAKFDETV